nr:aspartyl protease family protein 1-like [Quercus suber]
MALAWTSTTCSYSLTSGSYILLVLLLLGLNSGICHGLGSFGFDIHHRFSDPVMQILGFEGLPEKRSVEYYVAMTHRDSIIRGRHLAASNNQSPAPLTFANGNDTFYLNNLGSLYYANVSVGTPSVSYLVALDTGSDLFWLPCDCNNSTCETSFQASSGRDRNQIDISVPSTIARKELGPNSFSMCFGSDGIGRINFGDNGTSEQKETPFIVMPSSSTYLIDITQINVGVTVSKMEFNAIFDSGTSLTHLTDPVYTFISKTFNSQVTDNRHSSNSQLPFEYCYDLSANQTGHVIPIINLTMKGGDQYFLTNSTEIIFTAEGVYVYCLALLKSTDINIIGQNFMTGYHIVFNRDKMVLGWKPSNCYNDSNATTPSNHSLKLKAFTCAAMMLFVSFFAII